MEAIAYYRVSTAKQGRSGLGLDAQREAVRRFLNGNDRPELARALAACRVHGATLVIAKLDRLACNVAFISNLMESAVEFVAVDFPAANRLTVHILAAVAEHGREREMISQRTKAALGAAKARGVRLGGDRGGRATPATPARALEARQARADARARDLLTVIEQVRAEGATSLRTIARALNGRGIPAPRGGSWMATTVRRVLERAGAAG